MLQKWKLILTNWINCYFNETNKKCLPVNLESLLEIISHLRENLNLNESSILDAHTVQEFIAEKYPDFKFENGTVEPDSDVDVYLAASLLLFFVCVNSKEVDIKSAMCSKLSPGDQETILKFSKHLMECPRITNTDVQAAIIESCGQDTPVKQAVTMQVMVAETPPALRSYHSELRRLQAALDAERFDRTYLQEELTRTNLKVDKLLKDKEQYKSEIVELKSQISQYGGQDKESQGDVAGATNTSKLVKQLEQMEQRLVSTQEQLEDVQYERETYKTKLNQLKSEHDKLLAISQQESIRCSRLAEELDVERRQTQSLRELVDELRQHNHLNGINSSLLECDDPDASIHSLPNNSSTCSEVCANVIEVQLGEERAKIVELQQQLQLLQDLVRDITEKAEEEKQALTKITSENKTTITNLKHSVEVEVKEKEGQKAKIMELEQHMQLLQEQLCDLTRKTEDEKRALTKIISDNETIITNLKHSVDIGVKEKEVQRATIMKLEQQMQLLQEQLCDLTRKTEDEKQALTKIISDNESTITTLKHSVDIEVKEKEGQRVKIMELDRQMQLLQDELDDFTRKTEDEKEAMTKIISEYENTILNLKHCVKVETEEKEEHKAKIVEFEQQLQLLQDQLRHLTRQSEEETQAYTKIISDHESTIKNLNHTLHVERVEMNDKSKRIVDLEYQLQLLQVQINDLTTKTEEEKRTLTTIISDNDSTISNLKHSVNLEIKEKEVQRAKIVELEHQMQLLQEDLCDLIRKTEEEKQALTKYISDYQSTITNLKHSLNVETQEKNNKIAEVMGLEQQLQLLQDELRDLTIISEQEKQTSAKNIADIESTIADLKLHMNVEIQEKEAEKLKSEQLEKQMHLLQDQLSELTRKAEEEKQTLTKIISDNESTITNLKRCVNVEKVEKKEHIVRIMELEQQTLLLQNQLQDLTTKNEEEIQALTRIISVVESTITDLKHCITVEVEAKEEEKAKNVELKQQMQLLQDTVGDLIRKAEEEQQALTNVISDNESTIANLKHCLKVETEEKQEKMAEIMDLDRQMQLLQDQLSDLSRKTEEEKQVLTKIISDNESTISNLKHCVNVEIEAKEVEEAKIVEVTQQMKLLQDQFNDFINKTEDEKRELTKVISDNESTIVKLKHSMNVETEEKNEKNAKIVEVEQQLQLLQDELSEMTSKAEKEKQILTKFISDNENTITNLKHCVDVEIEEKKEKIEKIAELEQRLQCLQGQLCDTISKAEEEKQRLTEIISNHDSTITNLRRRVNVLQEEKEAGEARNVELVQETLRLQNQLDKTEIKYEAEKQMLAKHISDNESNIANLESRVHEEIERNKSERARVVELEHETQTLQNRISDLTSKTEQGKQASTKMISDYESTIANLRHCVKIETEEKKEKVAALEEQMQVLQEQLSDVIRKADEEKQASTRVIADNEVTILKLTDYLKSEREEKKDQTVKIEELETQLQLMQDQISDLTRKTEEENQALTKIISENETTIKNLEDCINTETKEKNATITKNVELVQQLQMLQDQLSEVRRKAEEDKTASMKVILDKESTITDLKQQMSQEMQEKQTEKESVKVLKQEMQLLQDQLSAVTKIAEDEKQALTKIISENENNIINLKHSVDMEMEKKKEERAKILELKEQMQLLQDQLSDVTDKAEEEKQTLTDIISEKENAIVNLKRRVNEEAEERKEDRAKIMELKQKIQKLQDQLSDVIRKMEEEKQMFSENILDKENIITNLKRRVNEEEKKEERTKIIELKQQIQTLQDQLSDLTRKSEEEKRVLTESILDKESTIANLKRRADEEIEEKKEERARITDLKHQMQFLQDQCCDITRKAEEGKQTFVEIISDNESTITNLKRRVSEEMEEKKEERAKNTELKQQMQLLQEHLRDITRKAEEENQMATETIADKESIIGNLNRRVNEEIEEKKEERAKIVELKHQTQLLQDQLCDVTRKSEEEKQSLTQIISEKESTIMNLKHRVNEEIEEKNILKATHDNDVAKLNNELNELDQRLKGSQENSRNIIEKKMLEIQNLKDEKLSLLQSLSDETTKLENIIKDLQYEVDAEKSSKIKLRDDYDVHIMKLNEKVLNRNNELVELQNKIVEKGEQIEHLQLELRREKELREELSNKHNNDIIQLNSIREKIEQDLQHKSEEYEKHLRDRDEMITQLRQEKDGLINKLTMELIEEKERCLKESESKAAAVYELRQKLEDVTRCETDTVKLLRKENEVLKKTLAMKESFATANQEKISFKSAQCVDARDSHHHSDNSAKDYTNSSLESYKTISDLEKILQDRNRTITSLQSDITHLKSVIAESENNLLDVSKDLEVSKENCQQLSSQLKKIVHQKNEEIAELKKQVTKMSMTENRASQIIKVSAKYQAMILKRIAEIKSNTVLKELTNFGNSANCDNDLRRSLTAGTVTMEDLENFLDTTDRHLRRCSEKQIALQKERDRLTDVNRINESEIINMRKFLTELSVSIKTFNTVKELYTQKMVRVVSLQRTVRREILSLDGKITDAAMCKLERGYAAVMQDLSECAMNLERWVERCIGRTISAEKIKQAFSSEERSSLASTSFQNASLEVQLEELESSFCKLLEEVARAQKGEGAKDAQAVTVMEVRAEYEDKLNRMKAKMKELYQEQIGIFKEKQREEIVSLEHELQKARDKLEESSRAYEEHIRSLTTELWNVGEKFLMQKDEAEWLRKKQYHGSLMSLQHVHSAGLMARQEEPSRPSDTHSLRSLPVASNTNNKKEGRTLQMSDEEGEVFDNRCLRELASTPRAAGAGGAGGAGGAAGGRRLSELRWRNSLCPPHLKSSYPAETQFAPALHEEDIKCASGSMSLGGRARKEVGITAYKKPGPPTPSKQAGRLSATDSELRESLRVETEPNASRKTSTPSRIRALFRSTKGDTVEGTPRSRRLSNIFRKK